MAKEVNWGGEMYMGMSIRRGGATRTIFREEGYYWTTFLTFFFFRTAKTFSSSFSANS